MPLRRAVLLCSAFTLIAGASEPLGRYAVILNDPAAAERISSLKSVQSAAAASYRDRILAAQRSLRSELAGRNFRVTGAAQSVLNAVFVQAPASRVAELRALPGVKAVAPLHRFRLHLNKAVELENVPAAWNALGGTSNAGAGVRIAIIDTGIDQRHPAFQGSSPPAGFTPVCTEQAQTGQSFGWKNCTGTFTNGKVIVARSYVAELASGALNFDGVARPDDVSPRDHIGHGTALGMITAGATNTGPTGITITGLAPKAWLGSYKVFGSPGLNDFTGGDVLISAVEDALNDGMNIAVLSLGSPAFTGPLDTGAVCGQPAGTPCDPEALAVENAVRAGMLVVASAGNSGDSSGNPPTLNSVESPATAPSAIAAGASTNSHEFTNVVQVSGPGVPANLRTIPSVFGDGPLPAQPLTAPAADVTKLDPTGLACNALAPSSLSGAIVLITRGTCDFVSKVTNAQNAGAAGVIFVDNVDEDVSSISPIGLGFTTIPAAIISMANGAALRAYLGSRTDVHFTMSNNIGETASAAFNQVAPFSSRGPSIAYALKPEAMGVGTNVYMATEKSDPNGEMYDPSGYIAASGTSFSAPMLAGAAALVKQKNPGFTALQLRSAVIGTASQTLTDNGQAAGITAAGNGLLDAGNAVATTVTTDPAAISFGAIGQTANLPATQRVTVHYSGTTAATLALSLSGSRPPALDKTSLSFTPGSPDQTVTLTLSGAVPPAGIYTGTLTIQGGGTAQRVPYLYVVGDGVAFDIVPITGGGFDGPVGQHVPGGLAFKVIDRYGVAVPNLPVTFAVTRGGGSIAAADPRTDVHGVATADAVTGPAPGAQTYTAAAGSLGTRFSGVARATPLINAKGIVNAASFQVGRGVVPGGYASIFGTALSDTTANAQAVPLPLAISQTSVSFEVPSAGLRLPGRLLYAEAAQVNVQVPWELAGQSSVQVRVNVGETSGQVFTVPVAQFSPAIYMTEQGTAAALDANNAPISASNAARRGQVVQLFVNGLGAVDNQPESGVAAPLTPLAHTATPTVTVGGRSATVEFSGLAPGFPGLDQVNFVVPADAPTGSQPVVVTIGGVSSPAVNMQVR